MLSIGTVVAQAIPLVVTPILTRIYSPDQFGIYVIYLAILAILSVVVTGRYEHAIMIQKSEHEAWDIVVLVILIVTLCCSLLGVSLLFFYEQFSFLVFDGKVDSWIFLFLPATIFCMGCSQALIYLANWKGQYHVMATSRVFRAGATSFSQYGLGWHGVGGVGMPLGHVLGELTQFVSLLYGSGLGWDRVFCRKSMSDLFIVACKYKNFPKYDIVSVLLNQGTQQLFFLWIGVYFGTYTVGLLGLTQRVLMAPIAFVGSSILDVFKKKARDEYLETGRCDVIFRKVFFVLVLLGCVPFTALFFYGEELFVFVFGAEWIESGAYARVLVILMLFRFVASPLTYVMYIVERQQINLFINFLFFLSTCVAVFLGYLTDDVYRAIVCYTVLNSMVYVYYLKKSYDLSCAK